ncbi:MAG: dihydrolipoyllysine-residue acetyltransferase [Pseudomonadota bacterium]|nr:dihydrolipoyllysine-residue acetyltransferase [Pseudomonadota bacterium]
MSTLTNQTVKVPDLGGAAEVEVIEISVAVGDDVSVDESIIVVESDKASMDIPSPAAGKVTAISVAEGSMVKEGDALLELEISNSGAVTSASEVAQSVAPESALVITSEAPAQDDPSATVPDQAPSTAPPTATESVLVPDLGGADKVELIELMVAVGDRINEGDGIVLMESDKASMELPSPASGVITALHVNEGDSLAEGDKVAELEVIVTDAQIVMPTVDHTETAVESITPEPANSKPSTSVPVSSSIVSPAKSNTLTPSNVDTRHTQTSDDRRRKTDVYAGPAVRKLARKLGVDLSRVKSSGPRGRLAKEDLHNYVKQLVNSPDSMGGAIPKVPEVDFSQFGEIVTEPMSKLHKITAANMHRNWLNVPHVTQFDDADITELEAFRQTLKDEMAKRGIKITPVSFLMKAVAGALETHRAFNASLSPDGESIIYKQYVHIGMAVDTPAGLMVPVLRDVSKKGIWQLSEEIRELADKAKHRKLKPSEMQGGCFTISSLGGIGGTGFTPIVNTPEVGILGVSKLAVKPVFQNGEFVPRKMLPLSLSYDHRAVNGGDAGRFMTEIAANLADVRRLLL